MLDRFISQGLAAEQVPRIGVIAICGGILMAAASLGFSDFSTDSLGAIYPARPLFQLGVALAVAPQIASVGLWYLRIPSRQILILGFTRILAWMLSVYVSSADAADPHGYWTLVAAAANIPWTLKLSTNVPEQVKTKVMWSTGAFIGLFILSMHLQSIWLAQGTHRGVWGITQLLYTAASLYFDWSSAPGLHGLELKINWAESYKV